MKNRGGGEEEIEGRKENEIHASCRAKVLKGVPMCPR